MAKRPDRVKAFSKANARQANEKLRRFAATPKRARLVRTEGEFPLDRLAPETRAPLRMLGDFIWDDDAIANARDSQLRGYFWQPAKLSNSMGSDAGIFTSRLNRFAPMRGLPIELRPADGTTRSAKIRDEAEGLFGQRGIAIGRDTLMTLQKQFVDHGVFFAYNRWTIRADGSRVDDEVLAWPIEFVRWYPQKGAFFTLTREGNLMQMNHGDGRWIIGQAEKLDPWVHGCVVPAASIWADRSFAKRDRSNASRSHGQTKFVGEMPQGVSIYAKDQNGNIVISPEAQAMLALLQAMHIQDLPYGLRPFGSKTDAIVNSSQAWQIWTEMIKTDDQDSSRIYLGQDGTTTNEGGDYIKSARLFGVRNDIIESDLGTFSEAFDTGAIQPWAAINFGDSRCAPHRLWLMPDADEDARRTSIGTHLVAFFTTISSLKQNGFVVDQVVVNGLCKTFGVGPFTLADAMAGANNGGTVQSLPSTGAKPPALPPAPESSSSSTPQPDDEEKPPASSPSLASAAE